MRKQYILEYSINSSMNILFPRLSTPIGLVEWFADDVTLVDDVFTFRWATQEQKAKVLGVKDMQSVRFQWIDPDLYDASEFFEFKVMKDDLTHDVVLIVTDFTDEAGFDDLKELWDTQVNMLKRVIGA
ncbi:MAG: START-like domain-containing protein [Salinivirgaceae bacterium]|nr:START-like domain-containing protein [Salinivirgaceae bacterium]